MFCRYVSAKERRNILIDLHTHSLFSDGELVVSELVRRAEEMGYRFIGITDHADRSNLDLIIPRVVKAAAEINQYNRIQVVAGIELTHVPPPTIAPLAVEARKLGARLVVVHGESIMEPVLPGSPGGTAWHSSGDFRPQRPLFHQRTCG
jgi:histidinol phosphatase-like PHP family hydrolase